MPTATKRRKRTVRDATAGARVKLHPSDVDGVLAAIGRQRWTTQRTLEIALDRHPKAIARRLRQLFDAGHVERVSYGPHRHAPGEGSPELVYSLTELGHGALAEEESKKASNQGSEPIEYRVVHPRLSQMFLRHTLGISRFQAHVERAWRRIEAAVLLAHLADHTRRVAAPAGERSALVDAYAALQWASAHILDSELQERTREAREALHAALSAAVETGGNVTVSAGELSGRAAPAYPARLVAFWRDSDPRLRQVDIEVGPDPRDWSAKEWNRDRRVRRRSSLVPVKPDAYLELERHPGTPRARRLSYFVEYDRGSEDLRRVERKLMAYWLYHRDGELVERRLGGQQFQVLYVTDGAHRRDGLRTRLEDLIRLQAIDPVYKGTPAQIRHPRSIFFFLALEDVAESEDLFTKALLRTSEGAPAFLIPGRDGEDFASLDEA